MGYYTNHTIEVLDLTTNKTQTADEFSTELVTAFEEVTEYHSEMLFYDSIKWYDLEDNMEDISERFPNYVFCVSGDGEESGDIWKSLYFRGELLTTWKLDVDPPSFADLIKASGTNFESITIVKEDVVAKVFNDAGIELSEEKLARIRAVLEEDDAPEIEFVTHNTGDPQISGTHLQGYVSVEYSKLKRIFGKPLDGDGYKVDAMWAIEFSDGMVATIYNYKDGKNYLGSAGTPKTKITEWHIGGHSEEVVERIKSLINSRS